MAFDDIVERAGQAKLEEEENSFGNEEMEMGEGENTTAHITSRGYIIKSVNYSKVEADNPCKAAENPHDHIERVKDIDRFPWAEIEDIDLEGTKDEARVVMNPWYLSHDEAAEFYHISDMIEEDLDMFFDLREHNITLDDMKPANIGYFQDHSISSEGIPVAKAIDITDGNRKPWTEEEDLPYRRFSDIMDVYIRGTPDEDGLTDIYPLSVPEAEEHVINYLGLESNEITGDPYKDLFKILDENQESMEGTFYYPDDSE